MPFCQYCGSEIEIGTSACPNCNKSPFREETEGNGHLGSDANKNDVPWLDPARPARRLIAGLIDLALAAGTICFAFSSVLRGISVTGKLNKLAVLGSVSWWLRLETLLLFLPTLYLILKDSFRGKSLGKWIMGLTVLNTESQKPVGAEESILRNFIFVIIAIPILGWLASLAIVSIIAVQISLGKPQRLFDRFAKSYVASD